MTWNTKLQWYTKCRMKFSNEVLADLPEIEDVTYFSDACAS